MKRQTVIDSPIGPLALIANDDGGLCGVEMEKPGWPYDGRSSVGAPVGFERVIEQFDDYFAGRRSTFELELAPEGNSFQLEVWKQLQAIPFGRTRTYGEIAEALGDRSLARSVGSACGANPLPIVIPCHRVIGADGSLVGFGGGLDRKRYLLHHENPAAFPLALTLF